MYTLQTESRLDRTASSYDFFAIIGMPDLSFFIRSRITNCLVSSASHAVAFSGCAVDVDLFDHDAVFQGTANRRLLFFDCHPRAG